MKELSEQEVLEKAEIVKKYLAEGWSIHYSFRMAGVRQRDQQLIRPILKEEIKKYKSKYPSSSGIETSRV